MEEMRKFSGASETDIWQQIGQDMVQKGDILEYTAEIDQQGKRVFFDIDIDLGGGFESGFETTTFAAPVLNNTPLRFHVHPQDWVNEIGKILGLEDVELGYPEFDSAYIIKTNQAETLKALFADATLRNTLLKFDKTDLSLGPYHKESDSEITLSLNLDIAVTNPTDLQEIYHLMISILNELDKPEIQNRAAPII
jgi:hypothetical protein